MSKPDCPCDDADRVLSGYLHRIAPNAPLFDPPVELTRCTVCRREHRADGVPYDWEEQTRIWAEYREAHPEHQETYFR